MKNLRSSAPLRLKKYPAYKHSGIEWLGSLPHHWTERRLKNIASVRVSNVDKKTVEGQVSIRLCNYVDVYYNDRITQDIEFMEATATSQQIEKFALREGDVLITKDSETPDDIAVPSLVVSNLDGVICGYHLALIRPNRSTMVGPYLSRALSAVGIRDQFHNSATGVTRFGLAVNDITDANILVPPIEEQRSIASFLDRKTTEIDALIAKKRRMIELLQEKRTAVISHAVTKGLDPSAPMKDSGVEWLGKIPEHWEVLPIKRIVSVPVTDGPHETPEIFDEGIPFVSAEAIRDNRIDFSRKRGYIAIKDHHRYSLKYKPKRNDIFMIKSGATTGNLAIVETDEEFNIWSPLAVIRADLKKSSPRYILAAMNSKEFQTSVQLFWSYGTQQNIGMSVIENLFIPLPPLPEQEATAAFLDCETARIAGLISKVEAAIDKLIEYRTALISAAVTGKIDVRDEVGV